MEYKPEFYNPLLNTDVVKHDLITAASVGDLREVQKMLREKSCSDPNAINSSGWSAIAYAAHYGHYNVIRMLIDYGCDVNFKEWSNGRTPLMLAASNGHTRCIETLVNHGRASIDICDANGKTAAYYATHYGHGHNKIIAKMLGINDSGRAPRPITKTVSGGRQPKIFVAPPSADRQPLASKQSGRGLLSKSSPKVGSESPAPAGSPFMSPFNIPLCFQNFTPQVSPFQASSKAGTGYVGEHSTPTLHVGSDLAQRRKRKDLLTRPFDSRDSSISPENWSSSENSEDLSSKSPPLPSSLGQLLTRLGLDIYKQLFADNGIDLYLFLILSENDFKALGITPFGHRLKLNLAQVRFRESVEIRNTQENFFADWLLNEREQLVAENLALKELVEQLKIKPKTTQSEKVF